MVKIKPSFSVVTTSVSSDSDAFLSYTNIQEKYLLTPTGEDKERLAEDNVDLARTRRLTRSSGIAAAVLGVRLFEENCLRRNAIVSISAGQCGINRST